MITAVKKKVNIPCLLFVFLVLIGLLMLAMPGVFPFLLNGDTSLSLKPAPSAHCAVLTGDIYFVFQGYSMILAPGTSGRNLLQESRESSTSQMEKFGTMRKAPTTRVLDKSRFIVAEIAKLHRWHIFQVEPSSGDELPA